MEGTCATKHATHHNSIDSDRVRSRSQLRITPSKHLCPRLHSLQVQAIRKPIARVVGQQVLEEEVLYHKSQRLQQPPLGYSEELTKSALKFVAAPPRATKLYTLTDPLRPYARSKIVPPIVTVAMGVNG